MSNNIPQGLFQQLADFVENGELLSKNKPKKQRKGVMSSLFPTRNEETELGKGSSNSLKKELSMNDATADNELATNSNEQEQNLGKIPQIIMPEVQREMEELQILEPHPEIRASMDVVAVINQAKPTLPLIGVVGEHHDERSNMMTRREVEALRDALSSMTAKLDKRFDDGKRDYKTLIDIVKQEELVYGKVFSELIQQVSNNMAERGEVLKLLRDRYALMFKRIPQSIKNVYVELLAQREMNRRMKEELSHIQQNMEDVLKDFDFVQLRGIKDKFEEEKRQVEQQTESELAKYLDLYTNRLERTEKALKNSEEERFFWMEGVKFLISKSAKESNNVLLVDFHRSEQTRFLCINSKISDVNDFTVKYMRIAEQRFKKYTQDQALIQKQLASQEEIALEVLGHVRQEIMSFHRIITERLEDAHKLKQVQRVAQYDTLALSQKAAIWLTSISQTISFYSSDKEEKYIAILESSESELERIFDDTRVLLGIYQSTPSTVEFQRIGDFLTTLVNRFHTRSTFTRDRILGEHGVIGSLIWLQSQVEDRLTVH